MFSRDVAHRDDLLIIYPPSCSIVKTNSEYNPFSSHPNLNISTALSSTQSSKTNFLSFSLPLCTFVIFLSTIISGKAITLIYNTSYMP